MFQGKLKNLVRSLELSGVLKTQAHQRLLVVVHCVCLSHLLAFNTEQVSAPRHSYVLQEGLMAGPAQEVNSPVQSHHGSAAIL